jgi:dTDP-4-amino-4,6-dideoxygalactose transaminase
VSTAAESFLAFRIPLSRLTVQHELLRPELDEAIERVLRRGVFAPDEEVYGFENEFAAYLGARYAVAVGSGGAALTFALLSVGISAGDEVVSVPNVDLSASAPITHAGARLAWADIDDRSYTLDPAGLERRITPRTRAVIAVHAYGNPADMDPILQICREHRLAVIEDAALAPGAVYRGRRVGTFGDAACFSFSPTKPLGAIGEAGMIVTNDAGAAERARLISDHGYSRRSIASIRHGEIGAPYEYAVEGFNGVMDELQAAVLRVKLKHLNGWIERRRSHVAIYRAMLAHLEPEYLLLPRATPGSQPAFRSFVVRSSARTELMWYLAGRGIATSLAYGPPLHLHPVYKYLGYARGTLPRSESVAEELLGLPLAPELSEGEIHDVASEIQTFFSKCSPVSPGGVELSATTVHPRIRGAESSHNLI